MVLRAGVEAPLGPVQHVAQAACRHESLRAFVLSEAFDERLIRFQLPHQRTQAHVLWRHGEGHTASRAARGARDPQRSKILHDLMQMIA